MRTTIEIRDDHRIKLLELAAHRGEKGFSGIVEEALATYFALDPNAEQRARKIRDLRGTLPLEEAEALRAETQAIRESWR